MVCQNVAILLEQECGYWVIPAIRTEDIVGVPPPNIPHPSAINVALQPHCGCMSATLVATAGPRVHTTAPATPPSPTPPSVRRHSWGVATGIKCDFCAYFLTRNFYVEILLFFAYDAFT